MKTLNRYMAINYKMETAEDPCEGGYILSFPDLSGCIARADTREDLLQTAEDGERAWTEASTELANEIRKLLKGVCRLGVTNPEKPQKEAFLEGPRSETEGSSLRTFSLETAWDTSTC